MLFSFRKGVFAFAAAAGMTATAAWAVDHQVLIVDGAYFPPLVYADPGDRLVFVNASSGVHIVQASDESWTSGPIPVDGSFTLLLDDETPLVFNASADTEGNGGASGDEFLEQIGEITYDSAPTGG